MVQPRDRLQRAGNPAGGGSVVFFVEMVGIWTFGAYWALKTWELSLSKLEKDPGAAVRNAAPESPAPR